MEKHLHDMILNNFENEKAHTYINRFFQIYLVHDRLYFID